MGERIGIFILTRFSVLLDRKAHSWKALRGRTNWKRYFGPSNPTLEEKRDYLFDSKRMAHRFEMFETILRPSLAQQTDRDFRHIALSSTLLPDEHRTRLDTLAAEQGFEVAYVGTDMHEEQAFSSTNLVNPADYDRLVTIRIDDDDALASDYVERVRSLSALDMDDYSLTFSGGIFLSRFGSNWRIQRRVKARTACGLVRVVRGSDTFRTVHALGPHKQIERIVPQISVPGDDMFLMTNHEDNMSSRRSLARAGSPIGEKDRTILRERFGLTI
ncbi:glycosyltransferase [Pontivivens ytuae]|uniref:Rhamnosyl transferase n=1 Tax=Pontivivens ytuae TaxID=2789856 RepID=A0A7S9LV03_9RHOB|nr:glycosyltransferase [Pontivivens ytuae]QPH55480.1 hypothetical protein I0K15_07020 [Pontivivens ytuae]